MIYFSLKEVKINICVLCLVVRSLVCTAEANSIMHFSHGCQHTVTSLASSLCVSWHSMVTLRCVRLYRERLGWLELEQRPKHATRPFKH